MGKEEFIDVLDENGLLTGEIKTRSEIHKQGLWHRCIVVAIVNEKNQVLLQQRKKCEYVGYFSGRTYICRTRFFISCCKRNK